MWGGKRGNSVGQRRAANEAVWQAFRADKEAFIAREFGQAQSFVVGQEGQKFLFVVTDAEVGLVRISQGQTFAAGPVSRRSHADLRGLNIRHGEGLENYRRRVVTPVAVTKRKSVVGRALVGAFVAGPAGMIVGAASGLSPSTTVREHVSHEAAVRVTLKPPSFELRYADGTISFDSSSETQASEIGEALANLGLLTPAP